MVILGPVIIAIPIDKHPNGCDTDICSDNHVSNEALLIYDTFISMSNYKENDETYTSLGYFFKTSGSLGLNDKAVAGRPSVTKFTQRSYMEENPSGRPIIVEVKILMTSPMFEEIIYLINAFKMLVWKRKSYLHVFVYSSSFFNSLDNC